MFVHGSASLELFTVVWYGGISEVPGFHLFRHMSAQWPVEMWQASVFSTGITLVDILQNWLNWFHFLVLERDLLVILIDCMIFLSPFLDVTRISM